VKLVRDWEDTSNVPDCIRFETSNIGTITGKSMEVVETLHRLKIDICCVQETRWNGSGARMVEKGMSRYKLSDFSFQEDGLIELLMLRD